MEVLHRHDHKSRRYALLYRRF